jgi:hypothetical protein
MLRGPMIMGSLGAGLFAMVAVAQEPTATPTPFGGATATATVTTTSTADTATPPPTVETPTPSTGTPEPTPTTEPEFNFDEVKEVVVPLIGDDDRTHYVTLSEDTAGVVRVRLSLFNFPLPFPHTVIVYDRADCSYTANPVAEEVLLQAQIGPDEGAGTALVLHFFNTTAIAITGGPRSIYDADGTSLAIYRPGDAGPVLRAACAVLAAPLGAPDTGTGVNRTHESRAGSEMVAAMVVVAAGVGIAWSLRRKPGERPTGRSLTVTAEIGGADAPSTAPRYARS